MPSRTLKLFEALKDVLKAIREAGHAHSRDEDFLSSLRVLVEHMDDGSKKLSQPGLCLQLLKMLGVSECDPAKTPLSGPVFCQENEQPHSHSFNCRSALGALMHLTKNA